MKNWKIGGASDSCITFALFLGIYSIYYISYRPRNFDAWYCWISLVLHSKDKKQQPIRRWKSIESNDDIYIYIYLLHHQALVALYDHAKLFKSFLKASIASSASIRRWKLPLWAASHPSAARCAASIYQPSLFSSTFSLSLAETGSRFHQILPVMSVASITRHYPSISRFPSWTSRKRTFRRSDTRNGVVNLPSFIPPLLYSFCI